MCPHLLLLLLFSTGPIMGLANALVYKGELQAGSTQVEQAQLVLPQPAALQQVSLVVLLTWSAAQSCACSMQKGTSSFCQIL